MRSTRAIRDKARELFDERGLHVSLMAIGIATWSNPFVAHRPTAPVLLRTATVTARDPAETDFSITVADDPIVNPVLLHALDTQLGLRFHADDLRDHSGQLKYPTVVERLREFAPAHVVDGFSIAHRAVLATFATAPLLLSRDVEDLGGEIEQHPVIAALAGDDTARAAVSTAVAPSVPRYLALDTDADQHDVIAAAAGGGNLLVDAPPGSGRTQTVAGIVAELAGRGQQVLVVGQKRATIDDLMARLEAAGLDDLVVDLGSMSPAEAVERVTDQAQSLRETAVEEQVESVDELAASRLRTELDAYREAVHRVRDPWQISAYDAMLVTSTSPQRARTSVRLPMSSLERMTAASTLGAALREYAELEGLTLTHEDSPWFGSEIPSRDAADSLLTTVVGLRDVYLPQLRDFATRAAVEVGLSGPATVTECVEVVQLLTDVERTVKDFGPGIWTEPIDDLVAATGTRAERAESPSRPGFFARRQLRRRAFDLGGRSGRHQREVLHAGLVAARDQLASWKRWSRDGKLPRTGEYLARAADAVTAIQRRLAVLVQANPRTKDFPDVSFAEMARRLNDLATDEQHLRAMPRLIKLKAELSAAGLDELIDDLRRRKIQPDAVEDVLEFARLASLLEHWRTQDAALRQFDTEAHRRKIEEFCRADQADVRNGANRVRQARAGHFAQMSEEFEGQAEVLAGSAHDPTSEAMRTPRTLLETAPDIALAAVPCWVMSPLAVASTLPPRRLFDVVIVEDAARLAVAQAVPALARGERVILMSDEEVAVTDFTTAFEPAPDPDEQEGPWAGDPPASVAETLRGILPERGLRGQHRFRDDRLVGFAARTGYAGRISTVPAASGQERLVLDRVDAPSGGDDPVDSSSAEVNRVVELVLEHLRARPHESLGIVTLGPRHAERLDAALRRALVRAPDVAPLLNDERADPFFVKDVERAAGDVRDAIVLSLGYGRSVDGRILYRFGALGRPGGDRRLMSATTRARERLTVVSTFGAEDLSPRRLTTPGAQALGDFLSYVESGARALGDEPTPGADALAEAVAHRLRQAGAAVEVGYGGPGGVAVAVRHPTRRDRFVLAVETDADKGPAMRSATVRERIRPMMLERLGWSVHRVWVEEWADDPDDAGKRLVKAYEDAVAAADAYDWAVAAAEADVVAGMPEEILDPQPASQSTPTGSDTASSEIEADSASGAEPGGDEPSDAASLEEADEAEPADGPGPRAARRVGVRPEITAGMLVPDYTCRELAALARWIESDGMSRQEDYVVDLMTVELDLSMDDARTRDVLRHAVRVARAGYPPK
nr:AAA domain-containing protein [Phytoactinopolyspora mesophila]